MRIVRLVLAASLVLGLVACGDDSDKASKPADKAATETKTAAPQATAPPAAVPAAPAPAPTESRTLVMELKDGKVTGEVAWLEHTPWALTSGQRFV